MKHGTPMASFDDTEAPRVPLWRRAAFLFAAMTIGAVVLIGVGQVLALTRSTCDTICRPGYAGTYGAIGGVIFAFMYKPQRPS